MATWSQSVFSTMASEVAYDDESQEMTVVWKNGRSTIYSDVPEDVAQSVANAPSVGQAINSEVKGRFAFRNA